MNRRSAAATGLSLLTSICWCLAMAVWAEQTKVLDPTIRAFAILVIEL